MDISMQKYKGFVSIGIVVVLSTLVGCSKEVRIEGIEDCVQTIASIKAKEGVKIIGLGEATHGNSELQTLKLDVFKALVENNDCKIFVIEGDFGGSAKVNEYISGGVGTSEEAAAQIGFAIYRTQEMADLIEWMKDYNKTVAPDQQLKFYGYDMQRYDHSKELLFRYLNQVDAGLVTTYESQLADLNDATVYNQDQSKVKQALGSIEALIEEMLALQESFVGKTSKKEFEFALQCAQSIKENATLRGTGANYSETRDGYMKDKVDWILDHEEQSMLFITGHNGHIEKTSSSVYTSMGDRLDETYGDAYYAIGTDFLESTFNAVTSTGKDQVMTVKNSNGLTAQFAGLKDNTYFMDFDTAIQNSQLQELLSSPQGMTNIGAEFNSWQKFIKSFYTLKMVPEEAYDGIVVLKRLTPSHKK